jgi:hypothetical protein
MVPLYALGFAALARGWRCGSDDGSDGSSDDSIGIGSDGWRSGDKKAGIALLVASTVVVRSRRLASIILFGFRARRNRNAAYHVVVESRHGGELELAEVTRGVVGLYLGHG